MTSIFDINLKIINLGLRLQVQGVNELSDVDHPVYAILII